MNLRLLPYTPERDAYRLLGIRSTASDDEIQAACRRLARTFHPDRNRSERATQEMQVVNVVRRVLTDPDERARYDRERHRFHAELMRPPPAQLQSWPPMEDQRPPRPSPVGRYGRAVLRGVGAALAGLTPRCRTCRAVIHTPDDTYCISCGTPRLTGG